MKFGIDHLLDHTALINQLQGRRVALLGHPASMTSGFQHSIDALIARGIKLSAAFGPQHGIRGDKQDNMVETNDDFDPIHNIPVFSLYGKTRRPTTSMLESFDILLIDLQDVGCRIYTFITTLFYLIEDCGLAGKALWILDRPNPAGRVVEGSLLSPGYESFVGAAPIPMRHGLTLGEAANWFQDYKNVDIDLRIIRMEGYDPYQQPGFGWPLNEKPWINPSPNIATLNAVRAYAGTVLLEGTTLSEGRGTTRALEMVGAPDINFDAIIKDMQSLASNHIANCQLRRCGFEPTFHKHSGKFCEGFQFHTDHSRYDPSEFKPYRVIALFLKCLRIHYPDYPIWREFAYEYVTDHLAIDVIDGGDYLRTWVDDTQAEYSDLEAHLTVNETQWLDEIKPFYLY